MRLGRGLAFIGNSLCLQVTCFFGIPGHETYWLDSSRTCISLGLCEDKLKRPMFQRQTDWPINTRCKYTAFLMT